MKKLISFVMGVLLSLSAYAADYTAQCKINSESYVVASQTDGYMTVINVVGYGQAKNSTVIVTTKDTMGHTYTYRVDIVDGKGSVNIPQNQYLKKVDNIVCN